MAVPPDKKGTFVKVKQGKTALTLRNSVARADSVWLSCTADEL